MSKLENGDLWNGNCHKQKEKWNQKSGIVLVFAFTQWGTLGIFRVE